MRSSRTCASASTRPNRDGRFVAFGAHFVLDPGTEVLGGYWIIPTSLGLGLLVFLGTHRLARAFLAHLRGRLAARRERLLLERT